MTEWLSTHSVTKLIVGTIFVIVAIFYISMTAVLQYHWSKYKVEGATMKGTSVMYYTMTAILLVIMAIAFISLIYD